MAQVIKTVARILKKIKQVHFAMKSSRRHQVQASFTNIIVETQISNNLTNQKIGRSSDIELAMCRDKILPYWNFSHNILAIVHPRDSSHKPLHS
ncbi:hypothetical protein TIFTF001_023765 [Ficus carica]|uniref:Uncharacterized protein n=1 Tax=Ficus carica TaxID=3494 RepID=A0AA88CST8_FICCA|nr:hypothetical protein TIFTF001_046706 [Ficus carica]GMN54635.1 hypothetical protein TIFTF001_023765 [Ficus carica]